jgi:hypothetical protein
LGRTSKADAEDDPILTALNPWDIIVLNDKELKA